MIRKKFSFVINLILASAVVYLLYLRLPVLYHNFSLENSKIESFSVTRLSGDVLTLPNPNENTVLMFWATWCEPCHIEMKKLSEMLKQGELAPNQVIAVSLDENKQDVLKYLDKNPFGFIVAYDEGGILAQKFKISLTPTLIFINKNFNIDLVTSGVSLDLKKKIKDFLAEDSKKPTE